MQCCSSDASSSLENTQYWFSVQGSGFRVKGGVSDVGFWGEASEQRTAPSFIHKCAAVPRWARFSGSRTLCITELESAWISFLLYHCVVWPGVPSADTRACLLSISLSVSFSLSLSLSLSLALSLDRAIDLLIDVSLSLQQVLAKRTWSSHYTSPA